MNTQTTRQPVDTVIWDFNGTLLDDLDLTVETINVVLTEHGVAPVDTHRHKRAFRFPIIEYYRDLGLDTSDAAFSVVTERYHDLYMQRVTECSLYDGIPGVLDAIEQRGLRQFVLSALNQTLLDECIDGLGLRERFHGVYGLSDIMGRSKIARGHDLVSDHGIDPARVLYIGDTIHDVEVAAALGFSAIAVSWGHQHTHMFDGHGATVARDPAEILTCLN